MSFNIKMSLSTLILHPFFSMHFSAISQNFSIFGWLRSFWKQFTYIGNHWANLAINILWLKMYIESHVWSKQVHSIVSYFWFKYKNGIRWTTSYVLDKGIYYHHYYCQRNSYKSKATSVRDKSLIQSFWNIHPRNCVKGEISSYQCIKNLQN